MIVIFCDLCRRVVAGEDADAVRDGAKGDGKRIDLCGGCLRDAADRIQSELKAVLRDPAPRGVRQRAMEIRLPKPHLRR